MAKGTIATMASNITIVPARTAEHMSVVADMFRTYTEALGIDLSYQDFSTELNGLPGKYAPPDGELLIAYGQENQVPLGCVALRPLRLSLVSPIDKSKPESILYCEMKRLYVSPAARGTGVGRILAHRIVEEARKRGYNELRLDTLPSMKRAIAMYEKLGFVQIDAYYPTPIEGTVFLALDLNKSHQ